MALRPEPICAPEGAETLWVLLYFRAQSFTVETASTNALLCVAKSRTPHPLRLFSCLQLTRRRMAESVAHEVRLTQEIVVCDHCNPPTLGALYEAFDAAWARQLVQRLALRYTPKHGSGLHIAENALRALTRPCVHNRRCGDTKPLAAASVAWSTLSHEKQRGVDWPCTIDDARTKLKSPYPKIQD